jgi:predicted GNAT family acetyltransferase
VTPSTNPLPRLREIQRAATEGPWDWAWQNRDREHLSEAYLVREQKFSERVAITAREKQGYQDARFIATFDPRTVGALLDVAEKGQEIDVAHTYLLDVHKSDCRGCAFEAALSALTQMVEGDGE